MRISRRLPTALAAAVALICASVPSDADARPVVSYAALGDSFSSGVGAHEATRPPAAATGARTPTAPGGPRPITSPTSASPRAGVRRRGTS